MLRLARVGLLTVSLVAIGAASAPASVNLGQLAGSGPFGICNNADFAQLAVGSGTSYTVPGTGSITQWSHNASNSAGQSLTFKVLRKAADPNFWRVIGIDGPRPLNGSQLNQFQVSIPVQAGDILGLDAATVFTNCTYAGGAGDVFLNRVPPLGLGEAGDFFTGNNAKVNVSAGFEPSIRVTLGKTRFNERKGTATLRLNLPNPGVLTASGKGVRASVVGARASRALAAGSARLVIGAKGAS